MDTFYSLQGYLYLIYHDPEDDRWCCMGVGGLLVLILGGWVVLYGHLAHLAGSILLIYLLCLPTWREQDEWLVNEDIVLLCCSARETETVTSLTLSNKPHHVTKFMKDVTMPADYSEKSLQGGVQITHHGVTRTLVGNRVWRMW